MALGSSPVRQVNGFRFPAQIIGLSAEGKAALHDEGVDPAELNGITRQDIERYLVSLAQRAPTTNVTTAIDALKTLLASVAEDEGASLVGVEFDSLSKLGNGSVQATLEKIDTRLPAASVVPVIGVDVSGNFVAPTKMAHTTDATAIAAGLVALGLMEAS